MPSNLSEVPPGEGQSAPPAATGSCVQRELCFEGEKFPSAIKDAPVAHKTRHILPREAFNDDTNLRAMCSSGKWVGYRREGWGDCNAEADVDKTFLAVDYFGML